MSCIKDYWSLSKTPGLNKEVWDFKNPTNPFKDPMAAVKDYWNQTQTLKTLNPPIPQRPPETTQGPLKSCISPTRTEMQHDQCLLLQGLLDPLSTTEHPLPPYLDHHNQRRLKDLQDTGITADLL